MNTTTSQRPLIASGVTLGAGMGGFADGIVFHQILQFHNMLSAKLAPTSVVNLEVNMFWDGVFHAACWILTSIGMAMVWNTARTARGPLRSSTLLGAVFVGWGLFNLIEGVIDHHILHLHHVTETAGHLTWDILFLGSGVVLMVGGWLLIRAGCRAQPGV